MSCREYEQHLEWVASRRESLRQRLEAMFPADTTLTLEIGCGHGHWLVAFAANHPERTCLGLDIVGDRIARAARKCETAGLSNVQFLKSEAMEALDLMPTRVRIETVFILFPDPWPKRRHWKNRLVNAYFLQELAGRCEPETRLHFRTDHKGYFEWAQDAVAEQNAWVEDASDPWPFESESVFQSRADSHQSMTLVRR